MTGKRDSDWLITAQWWAVIGESSILLPRDARKDDRLLHGGQEQANLHISNMLCC
jgi:hypothetical protein